MIILDKITNLCNACNFNKKETMAQLFSCEFCEISKNTSFLQSTSRGCLCTVIFMETVTKTKTVRVDFKDSSVIYGQAIIRDSYSEVLCKISVLKDFLKFTGKQLCQSLFFNKVAGWGVERVYWKPKEMFAGVEKECIRNEWVKGSLYTVYMMLFNPVWCTNHNRNLEKTCYCFRQ